MITVIFSQLHKLCFSIFQHLVTQMFLCQSASLSYIGNLILLLCFGLFLVWKLLGFSPYLSSPKVSMFFYLLGLPFSVVSESDSGSYMLLGILWGEVFMVVRHIHAASSSPSIAPKALGSFRVSPQTPDLGWSTVSSFSLPTNPRNH